MHVASFVRAGIKFGLQLLGRHRDTTIPTSEFYRGNRRHGGCPTRILLTLRIQEQQEQTVENMRLSVAMIRGTFTPDQNVIFPSLRGLISRQGLEVKFFLISWHFVSTQKYRLRSVINAESELDSKLFLHFWMLTQWWLRLLFIYLEQDSTQYPMRKFHSNSFSR